MKKFFTALTITILTALFVFANAQDEIPESGSILSKFVANDSSFLSFRDRYYLFSNDKKELKKLLNKELVVGWEWVDSRSLEYIDEHYSHRVKYLKHKDYPGIRIKDRYDADDRYLAFDDNGRLIRVIRFRYEASDFMADPFDPSLDPFYHSSPFGRMLAIDAYKANEYKIKEAGKEINLLLTLWLGLRKMTKAEQLKRKKKKSWEETCRDLKWSNQATNWLHQIREDYKDVFSCPFSLDRIDGTTFRAIYVDRNMNPKFEVIFQYTNVGDTPYTIEEHVSFKRF